VVSQDRYINLLNDYVNEHSFLLNQKIAKKQTLHELVYNETIVVVNKIIIFILVGQWLIVLRSQ